MAKEKESGKKKDAGQAAGKPAGKPAKPGKAVKAAKPEGGAAEAAAPDGYGRRQEPGLRALRRSSLGSGGEGAPPRN